MSEMINVEVAYALPDKQRIEKLSVAQGTTALEAVQQANMGRFFDDLPDLTTAKLGVFGKAVPATHALSEGERVEIYRELLVDPKAVRRARAEKAKAERA
jgi:putative ubiquitin-RnfH superfamily antitoxin RatB of RatAB toxin-antitoxin module